MLLFSNQATLQLDANSIVEVVPSLRVLGTQLDFDQCDYMELPRRTTAPAGVEGRMVYNSSTGYLNVYSSGAWWHANRDAGWA